LSAGQQKEKDEIQDSKAARGQHILDFRNLLAEKRGREKTSWEIRKNKGRHEKESGGWMYTVNWTRKEKRKKATNPLE